MATIDTVEIQLKVDGEKEATRALKRLRDNQDKVSQSVVQSGRRMESINRRWKETNKLYEKGVINSKALAASQKQLGREYAVLNGQLDSLGRPMTSKATAMLRDKEATEEAARAQQQYAQRMEQLRQRMDPVYKASQRYKQSMRELIQVQRASGMSMETFRKQAALLKREFELVSQGGRGARRSLNNVNIGIQQAGYQISDFVIQVQSGTSVFVAFSQQASQLAGILPLVHRMLGLSAGAAIALSSGLAIAIPLITVAAGLFFELSREAKKAEEELDSFESRIKSLDSSLEDFQRRQEALRLGLTVEQLDAGEALEKAQEDLEKAQQAAQELNDLMSQKGAVAGYVQGILAVDEAVRGLAGADTESKLADAKAEEAAALERIRVLEEKITEQYRKELDVQQDKLTVARLTLQHGEDSSRVNAEIARQEAEAYQNQLKAMGLSQTRIDALMEIYRKTQATNRLIEKQAKDAERASDQYARMKGLMEDIVSSSVGLTFDNAVRSADALLSRLDRVLGKVGSIISSIGSIGFENVGIQAEVAALKAGKTKGEASIEGQIASERARFNAGITGSGFLDRAARAAGNFALNAKKVQLQERLALTTQRSELTASGGSGGGGASAAGEKAVDYLNKLEREIEIKQSLIGLSEEEIFVKERTAEITERLRGYDVELNDTMAERIDRIVETEAAYRREEEARRNMEASIGRVENHIQTAFDAMVSGSASVEDAFKSMLRNILMEVWQQAVSKPIASGIGDFLGGILSNANGNAFSGGRVVPFANGGVVTRPTLFPMANGTGLMGEAGPEAIMPLKRGPNGKLGVQTDGAQSVTVNQTFQFSANGDESVKRIIAQEAPKIASLTQKQILDQRRRGGVMRSAFS